MFIDPPNKVLYVFITIPDTIILWDILGLFCIGMAEVGVHITLHESLPSPRFQPPLQNMPVPYRSFGAVKHRPLGPPAFAPPLSASDFPNWVQRPRPQEDADHRRACRAGAALHGHGLGFGLFPLVIS